MKGKNVFSQLKNIVDLIRVCLIDIPNIQAIHKRKNAILQILKIYYLLKDCLDDGEKLLTDVGYDPVGKVISLNNDDTQMMINDWDAVLRKQGLRLLLLKHHIFGQKHLTIINPILQEKISEVVGRKSDRILTLRSIGATLSLRIYFHFEETIEEKARLVALMTGIEDENPLNKENITSELDALRFSLDGYRQVVENMVSTDELLTLSNTARAETKFPDLE